MIFNKTFQKIVITLLVVFSVPFYINSNLNAQGQDFEFSGNNAESYQCIDQNGKITTTRPEISNGTVTCNAGETAVLIPPKLQQVEIWFVRILYIIWAAVSSLSFLYLVYLGFQYTITQGDVTKITEIRMKIIYYVIGFILVFLAVPVVSTTFRLLGINTSEACYGQAFNQDSEGNFIPGFTFFFPDTCYSGTPDGT